MITTSVKNVLTYHLNRAKHLVQNYQKITFLISIKDNNISSVRKDYNLAHMPPPLIVDTDKRRKMIRTYQLKMKWILQQQNHIIAHGNMPMISGYMFLD